MLSLHRIALFVCCIGLFSFTHYQPVKGKGMGIRGAFQLISETTEYNGKEQRKVIRKAPEWKGLYFFSGGHFSVTIEDQSRSTDWHTSFPRNVQELGYYSYAGKYNEIGDELEMNPEVALNPFFESRPRKYVVKKDGDDLVLTEELASTVESRSQGKRTIILRKLNDQND